MPMDRDKELVSFLLTETTKGKISWEPTATEAQFTTSFKGKYKIFVDSFQPAEANPYWVMKLTDVDDRELLTISDYQDDNVRLLFDAARRKSLNVDAAIDEIMGSGGSSRAEIKDEDIPF